MCSGSDHKSAVVSRVETHRSMGPMVPGCRFEAKMISKPSRLIALRVSRKVVSSSHQRGGTEDTVIAERTRVEVPVANPLWPVETREVQRNNPTFGVHKQGRVTVVEGTVDARPQVNRRFPTKVVMYVPSM